MMHYKTLLAVIGLFLCASAVADDTDANAIDLSKLYELYDEEEGEFGIERSGQVPIPPAFNMTRMSEEMQTAYLSGLIKEWARNSPAFSMNDIPPSLVPEASEPGEEVEVTTGGGNAASWFTTVGWVSCDIQAHYPHKGRDSGTVKAKA